MTIAKALFSSAKTTHETPDWLFNQLHKKYKFTVDAAANRRNRKLKRYWGPKSPEATDSLSISWEGETAYLNCPYGRGGVTEKWCRKAYEESQKDNTTVVALLPARTDTAFFHDLIMKADTIYFCRGRITFVGSDSGAPFPSVIVVWKKTSRTSPRFISLDTRRYKGKSS